MVKEDLLEMFKSRGLMEDDKGPFYFIIITDTLPFICQIRGQMVHKRSNSLASWFCKTILPGVSIFFSFQYYSKRSTLQVVNWVLNSNYKFDRSIL